MVDSFFSFFLSFLEYSGKTQRSGAVTFYPASAHFVDNAFDFYVARFRKGYFHVVFSPLEILSLPYFSRRCVGRRRLYALYRYTVQPGRRDASDEIKTRFRDPERAGIYEWLKSVQIVHNGQLFIRGGKRGLVQDPRALCDRTMCPPYLRGRARITRVANANE